MTDNSGWDIDRRTVLKSMGAASVFTAIGVPAISGQATADSHCRELTAAQNENAGDVCVWNDQDYLYVRYKTNESWCLTETHLHVDSSGTENDDIPTTKGKKSNPIPGQFEYSDTHDCVDTKTYKISLEEEGITECDTDILVAAHAVVKNRFECEDAPDETLYLIDDDIRQDDPDQESPGELYSVNVDQANGRADLTLETTLVDDDVEYLRAFAIAATPDGTTFYIVDRDTGQFGKYTESDGFMHLGTLSLSGGGSYPGGVVQLTYSPDGALYATSYVTNKLYTVDVDSQELSPVGGLGVRPAGADIAFAADGTLYMWSNQGSDRGLYTVDTDSGTASAVGETGSDLPKLTGLALLGGGTGDLIGSKTGYVNQDDPADPDPGEFAIISKGDGSIQDTYTMYDSDGEHVYHAGDLTLSELCELRSETAWGEGDRFTQRGNWGMYFEDTIDCEQVCVDFSSLGVGSSVEGLGTVHPSLNIQSQYDDGNIVVSKEGTEPGFYGSTDKEGQPSGTTNGCLDWGFADEWAKEANKPHKYTFTFDEPIRQFSLRMLDFGDLNRDSGATTHSVEMVAYDGSDEEDKQVLKYTSDGGVNPDTWTPDQGLTQHYDSLTNAGDACTAKEGEPGNYVWNVAGSGINKIELICGEGYDPNIAFTDLCFTPEL